MNSPPLDRLIVSDGLWKQLTSRPPIPRCESDLRRFPRRSKTAKVEAEFVSGYPACRRERQRHLTLVTDLSRCGLSFLHSEQVFPGERLRLALAADRNVVVEAVRCRKLGQRCYEVGGRFVGK